MKLNERTEQIYKEIENHCKEQMGFLDIDHHGLRMLAMSMDAYLTAEDSLASHGMTQVSSKSGFLVPRPEVMISKLMYERILRLADRYGMSPAARKKILGTKKPVRVKTFDI